MARRMTPVIELLLLFASRIDWMVVATYVATYNVGRLIMRRTKTGRAA